MVTEIFLFKWTKYTILISGGKACLRSAGWFHVDWNEVILSQVPAKRSITTVSVILGEVALS